MRMAMMLRRGGLGRLRAFRGNFANLNFSTKTTSSPSPALAYGAAADVAADDLLLDNSPVSAAKVEMEPTLLQPRVVVYDGVCHLCHNGVKWVIEADKDKKIKFCCLQSKAAESRVCGVDREESLLVH